MRVWQAFLTVVVIGNSIALGLIYWRINRLAGQFPFALLDSSVKTQNEISLKLNNVQSLLSALEPQNNQNTAVLGAADLLPDKVAASTPSATYLAVAANVTDSVMVYKEKADFSAVLGQLIPSYKYPYLSKSDDWYLVSLTSGKTGWVKAAQVSPMP